MSLNNLLNQFLGSTPSSTADNQGQSGGLAQTLSSLTSNIPGGLAGGAAAGGIMALIMSNKSARKVAGTAAKYGGAAMLGGLAFKAYQNWQSNDTTGVQQTSASQQPATSETFHQQAIEQATASDGDFELTIIKAMIAAAKADGHIDAQEQQRIFQAVEKMDLSAQDKGMVFDYLQKDIPIEEIANGIGNMELKAEVYLASCLVIDTDHAAEREHLDKLGSALALPRELLQQLELQAHQAYAEAA